MDTERMLWGVKNGDLEVVKAECQKDGFDVNAELLNGRNAIHYAADYGQHDVLKFLVKIGADVDLPDKHGITALLAAVYESHTECCRLLIEKGAQKSGKSPDGRPYADCAEDDDIKALLK